jgi:Uma2 family endonuclease
MTTAATKLTYDQFQAQYGHAEKAYEFWYGEAIPKGMPTWVHGLLQKILLRLLDEAGYIAGAEVELRIDPEAHPRPDVIASKSMPTGLYPTQGLDVVVEIISEDDSYPVVMQKCRKYQEWGFGAIYIVDPSDRSVRQWEDGALIPRTKISSIPVQGIWDALDEQYQG